MPYYQVEVTLTQKWRMAFEAASEEAATSNPSWLFSQIGANQLAPTSVDHDVRVVAATERKLP